MCIFFRGQNSQSPVLYSIGKLIKYHLGSVAKGSFLITLFKIPRLILTFLHAKLVYYFLNICLNHMFIYMLHVIRKLFIRTYKIAQRLFNCIGVFPIVQVTWYTYRLTARAEKGSECAKCGLKCGICCFYCLEKFIRYLNHNAYTIITIERVHFCKAAAKVTIII